MLAKSKNWSKNIQYYVLSSKITLIQNRIDFLCCYIIKKLPPKSLYEKEMVSAMLKTKKNTERMRKERASA
jgi:hypothetical protein